MDRLYVKLGGVTYFMQIQINIQIKKNDLAYCKLNN